MSITAERVSQLIQYSPVTGEFRWRDPSSRRVKEGDLAGTWRPDRDGQKYLVIKLDGRNYRAHRLAWLVMTGEDAGAQVDHRNSDKADNRFENLRLASDSQNKVNRPAPRISKSGIKGVRWRDRDQCWEARIRDPAKGKTVTVGYFTDADEARAAYKAAAVRLHGEFVHQSV